tara:strand:+ start:10265 stop:11707 length:1443 start_codon:yes stop_codon:yes gene_type:complete
MITYADIVNKYLKTSVEVPQHLDVYCGNTGSSFLNTLNNSIDKTNIIASKKYVLIDDIYYNEETEDTTTKVKTINKIDDSTDDNIKKYNRIIDLYKFYGKIRNQYDNGYLKILETYNDIASTPKSNFSTIYDTNDLLYNCAKLTYDLDEKDNKNELKDKYFYGNFKLYIETMYYLVTYVLIKNTDEINNKLLETTNVNIDTDVDKCNYDKETNDSLSIKINESHDDNIKTSKKKKERDLKDGCKIYTKLHSIKKDLKITDNAGTKNIESLGTLNHNIESIKNVSKQIDKIKEDITEKEEEIDILRKEYIYKWILVIITIGIIIFYRYDERIVILSVIMLLVINIKFEIKEEFDQTSILNPLLEDIMNYLKGVEKNSFLKEIFNKDINKELEKYKANHLRFERNLNKLKAKINNLMETNYILYTIISILSISLIMIVIIERVYDVYSIKIISTIIVIMIFITLYAYKSRTNFYKKDFVKPM